LGTAVGATVVEDDPVWAALMSATPASEPLSDEEEVIVDEALEGVLRGKRGARGTQVPGMISHS
jgi:hypothetical protein